MAKKASALLAKKKKKPVLKFKTKAVKKAVPKLSNSYPAELASLVKQLDALSDLSLITDSDGKIITCGNPARHLKCNKKIFIDKSFFLFILSDFDKERILKEVSSQKYSSFSFTLEYSKNKTIPVLSRWSSFVDKHSGRRFYLVLNHTVNNIHQLEGKELIRDTTGEFTWFSTSGLKDRSSIYSNNLSTITGYSQTEIKRRPEGILSIVYEEDYPAVIKSYNDFVSAQEQENIRMIYRIEKKNKTIIWVKEVMVVERNKSGKPKKATGVISDVTDLMKADEALIKTIENLKKQNASKDKFISVLSHDLRAPFTSILGFAEILINEDELSQKERLEYLLYIHESSQNQLQLINYLLDWSRLQTGRIRFEPQRLHAQSIVFNCVSSLTGNTIRKSIDIKVNVNDKIYVQADEKLLIQIVSNLLSNSIKFSATEKKIEIKADIFNDEFIEFVIKDEGIGITEENKTKLFKFEEMFSTEGTKGEKGTGLGLSLVKEIVEKHKGNIWFYSEYEKGSEFHFTIPRSANIILLVDNNENDKKLYEKLIKEIFPSYKIISVSNGYEAMNIVLDKLPSLVVTENEMPLMNGVQLIEAIRREEKNFSIPIILATGVLSDPLRNSYNNLNVLAILEKPIEHELFVEKLESALDI
jgi:PAS domain S-box-containing protein